MRSKDLLKQHRNHILRIAKQCGAKNVRVFGSVIRLEETKDSDIDVLVSMEEGRSLLDLIHFEHELEDLLGREVDVVSEGGVSPYIRDKVLQEAKPL